uniref:Uncharacterized protein n=1 Tax=Anguilla anguilla TaxID=7936 RepID=A0A0E9SJH0_ANGAN
MNMGLLPFALCSALVAV